MFGMDTDVVCCDCRDLAAIGRINGGGSARHACDCRDLAAIGRINGGGSARHVVTAGILLSLDVSMVVGRPGML